MIEHLVSNNNNNKICLKVNGKSREEAQREKLWEVVRVETEGRGETEEDGNNSSKEDINYEGREITKGEERKRAAVA